MLHPDNRHLKSRATIVGAGRSGIAAAELLRSVGLEVFVTDSETIEKEDRNRLVAVGASWEENGHSGKALETDYLVISPGVPSTIALIRTALQTGLPIYSEIEVASWFCAAPIVAVTGSNGKTTTTSLLGDIYRKSGRRTWVAGNIGVPFSAIVSGILEEDQVVLEVSSFQLDHIDSFRPHVSVVLNISPDHLNRYESDLLAYARSKFRIWENQGPGDALVYNMDDAHISTAVPAGAVPDGPDLYGITLENGIQGAAGSIRNGSLVLRIKENDEVLMQTEELALRGRHNACNSLAAAVAARVTEVRSEIVRKSLSSFGGVAHRLEFVREIGGVRYINDSKATNVNAVWYALESLPTPVVLIAGGRDKGNDYSSLASLARDRVRILIAIGESAGKVDAALGPHTEQRILAESMEDAVNYASLLARSGESVLLSPACSSFDMFRDYEHRGDVFKRLVSNL